MATATATRLEKARRREVAPKAAAAAPAEREKLYLSPPVDVREDREGLTLLADLPGVDRDGLSIEVEGDTLLIEAASRLELPKGAKPTYAEQRALAFRRRFTLSGDLDTERIDATIADGVLTVRIPKTKAAQPRRIDVRAG